MRNFIIVVTLLLGSVCASAQTAKEWRDSLSYLSQLVEKNPKSLELRMRKAEANIALEQWQYALDEYSGILDMYPTHLGALYFRAFVNSKMRRYSFARQDYEQVLRYAPDHEGALTGLVKVDIAEKKLQRAYDDANHLLELHGKNPRNFLLRAEVEEALALFSLAVEDVSTAIEMEGDRISANQRLGYNDDFTQFVLRRIELYKKLMASLRKKSDKEYKALIESDQQLLVSKGLPSHIFGK